MLRLSFAYNEQAINNVDGYFNNNYEDEWFTDPLVKEMVKSVDNTEVVSPNLMLSPVLGPIPPMKLSGGVKALIIMLKVPDVWVWGTACGDNCSKWIIQIGKMQDINVSLTHLMMFEEDFDAICVDTGEHIHCLNDYWRCARNGFAAR